MVCVLVRKIPRRDLLTSGCDVPDNGRAVMY